MLRASLLCFGLAALAFAAAWSWRAAVILCGVWAALGLIQWCLVKVSIESKPRIRRLDYQTGVWGPQEIRRLGELQRTGEHMAAGNQEGQVSTSSKGLCASGNPAGGSNGGSRPFVDSDGWREP